MIEATLLSPGIWLMGATRFSGQIAEKASSDTAGDKASCRYVSNMNVSCNNGVSLAL